MLLPVSSVRRSARAGAASWTSSTPSRHLKERHPPPCHRSARRAFLPVNGPTSTSFQRRSTIGRRRGEHATKGPAPDRSHPESDAGCGKRDQAHMSPDRASPARSGPTRPRRGLRS
jgi:hypothetical protein